MLAVTLGHLECVRVLLNNEANVNCENPEGWTGNQLNLVKRESLNEVFFSCSRSCSYW